MPENTTLTRVLICANENRTAKDLENRVISFGFAVCGHAAAGEEALEAAGRVKPDIVIMDIPMRGGMEGADAAEAIRAKLGIPLVLMFEGPDSGHSDPAGHTHPFGRLIKPVTDSELKTALETGLYVAKAEMAARKAERAFWENEEQFRTLLNQAPMPYQALDEGGHFIEVNPVWLDTMGYSKEEVLGRYFGDFLSDAWKDHFEQIVPRLKETGTASGIEWEMIKKDGSKILVRMDGMIARNKEGAFERIHFFLGDTTRQKKVEQELIYANLNMKTILESIPADIYISDMDTYEIHYMNSNMIHSFGRDCTGEPCHKAFRGLSEPCPRCSNPDLINEDGEPSDVIIWTDLNPVNHKFYLNHDRAIRWPDGRYVRLQIGTDITDRRRVEEALRISEERYRSLFNSTLDGVCLHEIVYQEGKAVDYIILDINPKYETILGISRDKAIGALASKLYGAKEPPYLDVYSSVVQENSTRAFETYFEPMDKHFYISVFGIGPDRFATVFQDITDRKKTEDDLRRKQEMLARTEKIAHVGSWEWDIARDRTVWSDELFHIFKLEPSPSAPSWAEHPKLYHPEDFAELSRAVEKAVVDGTPYELELRALRKDGAVRICIARGFSERDLAGNIVRLYGSLQDITERKMTEVEREKLQVQLVQAQKLEAVGTLAGGVAHDFNNLLQAINGYTQLLLMNKPEDDPDHSNLMAIHSSGKRASDLVRSLLLFSRKADTERKPVELNLEIERARKILERTIPKMIEIVVRSGDRLPAISADPVQIEQILLNLGTNAADAMPDGGRLVIETANAFLDDHYASQHPGARSGHYVHLAISDTGQGMPVEIRKKIFEPFFTTKEIGRGTGLGLASVYGIVKNHGGYITCYSEPGQGTTFNIYFPAMQAQKTLDPEDVEAELPPGGDETILLVDDEEAIRDFAQRALAKFGYRVLTASTGEEALGVYKGKPGEIDLVITDIGMPGMGGYKCLKEILALDPDAKVLIASGYSIDGQVKQSLDAGAMGYIAKPYQLAELLGRVRNALDETK